MALNASKVAGGNGGNRVAQPVLEIGNYPARLVQIIDYGLQAQRPYQGKDKPPVQEIGLTYELLDAFMVDDKGNELEDKPRWMSENMPLHNLKAEKARSTVRYHAFDAQEVFGGDWTQVLGQACMVTVVHNPNAKDPAQPYQNVGGVSAMRPRDAANAPELKNPARFFDLDNPDIEMFSGLPQWIREKIQSNLNYKGSKLEKLVGGAPAPKQQAQMQAAKPVKEEPPFDGGVEVDDNPY